MPTFRVTLYYTCNRAYEVEADSAEEAERLAKEQNDQEPETVFDNHELEDAMVEEVGAHGG